MADTVELWIVDPATGETILRIQEARRCPLDRIELAAEGGCPACGLNWVEWD
jgi:hypothetical protein